MLRPRAVPLWPSKVLSRALIETSVGYDSLTRRYELARTIEIKPRKSERMVRDMSRKTTTLAPRKL